MNIQRDNKMKVMFLALIEMVTGSFGLVDISTPTFSIPYHSVDYYHSSQQIEIFSSLNRSSMSPVWYYTPAAIVLSRTARIVLSNRSATHSVTVEIKLWDADYVQHIRTFLDLKTGDRQARILPIPFKWIHLEHHMESDYDIKPVKSQWQSVRNFPQTVSLRIRCVSISVCELLKKYVQWDTPTDIANVQLAFAFDIPAPRAVSVCFDGRQVQHTPTLILIRERLAMGRSLGTSLYVQHAEYYDIVYELVTKTMESETETDEFIDDEQINTLVTILLQRLRYNMTSTADFTKDVWKATYWTDQNERPDPKAHNMQGLFGSGMRWLQETSRGDNETGALGAFGHSQAVMQALVETRSGEGSTHWNHEKNSAKPVMLYCLDMYKLNDRKMCNVTVRLTNGRADYHVTAIPLQSTGGRYRQVQNSTSTPVSSTMASTPLHAPTISHTPFLVPALGENECGGWIKVTDSSSGFLRSPTGPSSRDTYYPSHASCKWLVTGPRGKQLKFTEESSYPFSIVNYCHHQKLVINDIEYCYNRTFSTVTVPSSITVVTFRTDGSATGLGFSVKVEAV